MTLLKPLPRAATRPLSVVVLIAWLVQMAVLVDRSYMQGSTNLATDLSRYGSTAQWRGVYYRGEKLGFTVSQTIPIDDDSKDDDPSNAVSGAGGFELQEDGQLQMTLLGAHTVTKIRTTARVDRDFVLRSFEFSLDPGTGPIQVTGRLRRASREGPVQMALTIKTAASTRTETLDLSEPPLLTLNLSRRLADSGLTAGARYQWSVFDPATLRNAPITVEVGERELVRAGNTPIPAFRVEMEFAGLRTTSWVTDTGEVVREESPLGLIAVRESAERATTLAVPGQVRADLLEAAAVVPAFDATSQRIDDPRDVRRLRLRLEGADLSSPDLQGVGQSVEDNVVEINDMQALRPGPADPGATRYLVAEPFIESDAPEIRAEAEIAVRNVPLPGRRAEAEALTRYVNSLVQKKPTVSLPSAREVLRTKIGDCNEHTALFVAMARAIGIPARIAVGLAYVRGAFYYHAWPEVYLDEGAGGGLWLPVDPTFNQFPADATHLRLARGGLDKQASIIPLIGRLKMTVLDLDVVPGSTPILVGAGPATVSAPVSIQMPPRQSGWCLPCWGDR